MLTSDISQSLSSSPPLILKSDNPYKNNIIDNDTDNKILVDILNSLNNITNHLKTQTLMFDKIDNNVTRITREFDSLRDIDDKYKEHNNILTENNYVSQYISTRENKNRFDNENEDEDHLLNCFNNSNPIDYCKCVIF